MTDSHQMLDEGAVERFLERAHRREKWRLALHGLFLLNALAALGVGLWVLWSHDPASGTLPALAGSITGLVLLGAIWRRSLRRVRDYRDRSLSMRDYLAAALGGTRDAVREQKLILLVCGGVLTPAAAIAVFGLVREDAMTVSDAIGFAVLYGSCLLVVITVCFHRLRHDLLPGRDRLSGWLRELESGG